jgi:hypothetical protein
MTAMDAVFSSTFPVSVYTRPTGQANADWQEFDQGPGIFHVPEGQEVMVRIKNIDNAELRALVRELTGFPALTTLSLSENRKITDAGLEYLHELPQLRALNLSSCSLTDAGLTHLASMPVLETIDLSYCNRLTDAGLKALRRLPHLNTLQLHGCLRITTAGVARFGRRKLAILR